MSNVRGKMYALTAFTRMRPFRTLGLRLVFALIRVSLMPPAARGFATGLMLGVATAIVLALIHLVGVPFDLLMREGLLLVATPGVAAWFVGLAIHVLAFGVAGAIIGRFYQPKWSILGRISMVQTNLVELSFIHFARWVIVPRGKFPRLSEAQPVEKLNYDYLLFESNFNGDWEQYIDAFSLVVPGGMDNIWRWSENYPGSQPITPFLVYIRKCQYDTDYCYSAYPGASTNDIVAALALQAEVAQFVNASASLAPADFAREYNRFLARVQTRLAKTDQSAKPYRDAPKRVPAASPTHGSEVAHV